MYLPISKISKAFGIEIPSNQIITSVVTDSRDSKKGSLFVGMKGSRTDGSIYAKNALDLGATFAIVENLPDELKNSDRVLKVKSGRMAMLKIGKLVRDEFDIPFVAVTGSVGKTTTKDFIACVLSRKYRTHKNIESKNDEIGVPNTLFNLNPYHQVAVLEFGMDHFGDIKLLSDVVNPTIGVVTKIGFSHIGNIGSKERILEGKLQITSGMKTGSPLILNGNDELLSKYKNDSFDIQHYGIENSDFDAYATEIEQKNNSTEFSIIYKGNRYFSKINALGDHIVEDAVAAFLVGVNLGIDANICADALSDYFPSGMRQHITQKHGITIVEDCYNSSPESLLASTKSFACMKVNSRKIMVLSDMLELGVDSQKLHIQCGEYIGKQNFDSVFAFGQFSKELIKAVEKSQSKTKTFFFDSKAELIDALKKYIKSSDTIWFKASHAQHLEEAIFAL